MVIGTAGRSKEIDIDHRVPLTIPPARGRPTYRGGA